MGPTPSDVAKFRYVAKAIVRLIGVLLIFASMFPFCSWAMEGYRDSDFLFLSYYAPRILAGIMLIFCGVVVFFASGIIAKILLPIPIPACPNCSYRLKEHLPQRCPECGLSLTEPPEFGRQNDG